MAGAPGTLQGVREVSARGDARRSSGGGEIASSLVPPLHDETAGRPAPPVITAQDLARNEVSTTHQRTPRPCGIVPPLFDPHQVRDDFALNGWTM
jgi:hypothetical protein